jgi:hypothetical protein
MGDQDMNMISEQGGRRIGTNTQSKKNLVYSSNTESNLDDNDLQFDQIVANDSARRQNKGNELNTPISSYQDKRSATSSPGRRKKNDIVLQSKVRVW